MERKKEWKFICLSLLMVGAGMLVTACSSDDEDPVKKTTRDDVVVLDTDSVVLDADTLKVFEDYEAKFQLLNADNLPVRTFKEGENFTFQLTLINPGDDYISLPMSIMDMLVLFDIYSCDGVFLGRPYDAIGISGTTPDWIGPHGSVAFTCKAFGKRDWDVDLGPDPDYSYDPNIQLFKTEDKEPLPKGKYYTEFTVKYENFNVYKEYIRDSVVFKKEFTIE